MLKYRTAIKSRRNVLFITGLFVLLLTCIRLIWIDFHKIPDHPAAVEGVLDLSDTDITDSRVFKLDGQWEFYPSALIMQHSGGLAPPPGSRKMIQVPGNWGASLSPSKGTQYGYGSYRLRLQIKPEDGKIYSIHIPDIPASSELFVNGRLLAQSGRTAASEEQFSARNVPYTASFAAQGDGIEIVIQAANFVNGGSGGIIKSIKFGTVRSIENMQSRATANQLMVCVLLLMHAVYACSLYLMGVHKKELLLFFAVVACMTGAVLVDDDKLLLTWLPVNYEWSTKLLTLFYVGVFVFLCHFTKHLLIEYTAPRAFYRFTVISVLYALCILVLPSKFLIYISFLFAFVLLYPLLVLPALTFRVAMKGGKGGVFLMLGSTGVILNTFWGTVKNFVWPEIGFYPVDLTVSFIAFACFWFRRYFLTSARTEELAVKLQAANKQKDNFLANTSHELRNPLHGILNIAQSVLDSGKDLQDSKNRENLALLISIGKRMSFMLNDLLDLARLQEKGVHLQVKSIRIQAVASYVIDMLQFMTEGKSIRIVNGIPDHFPAVTADENRLAQIMFNLLHNAVKYTPEGSISVQAAAVGGIASIRITDTGIGMDEETMQRIFQPYEQGHSEKEGIVGGIGLGLSICKQLIELHGGALEVTSSAPGQGSVFTFTLPLSGTSAEPGDAGTCEQAVLADETAVGRISEPYVPAAAAGADRKRILVVDDDALNLKILVNLLSNGQYDIVTAANGMEAIALLDKKEWDLIITDVMMPQMSGYELSRFIRERFSLSELPILLLTARSQTEDLYAGFLAGANDYVMKPVDAIELKARVSALTELTLSIRERLRMEAAWLQAQIQPHFIFNTLNAIAALSEIDTERMRTLIEVFGNYLRSSFDFQNLERVVTLEHELDLVRSYLFIEKQRFENKLDIRWDLDPNLNLQLRLPPLTIQTLVENAVRHGILKRVRGGRVVIRITGYHDSAEIRIEDDGIGMDDGTLQRIFDRTPDKKRGIGLLNTDRRLKQVYGRGLEIQSSPDQGTVVSFTITNR